MMIDKRLIGTVQESKKFIAGNVGFQWVSLCANILLMGSVTRLLEGLWLRTAAAGDMLAVAVVALAAIAVRRFLYTSKH